MRVACFFTSDYPNGNSPMSYRLHCYMKSLKDKGVEVEIVMPSLKVKNDGIHDGINYSFVRIPYISKFQIIKKARTYANICESLSQKFDSIILTTRDIVLLTYILKSVKLTECKIILELNENPFVIRSNRYDNKVILYLKRKYYLNHIMKEVDGIITISQPLYDLANKYISSNGIVIKVPILSINKTIIRVSDTHNKPFILHAGALSEYKDGVKAMLKAFLIARKALNNNLDFVFTSKVGFPSLIKWIDNFIDTNKLSNGITFLGYVSREKLDSLYANCSLSIVNKPKNKQNSHNFPTKLTELLPRRIPLIISKTGEINNYFENKKNAFLVEPNNVNQIAESIIYLVSNPKEAKDIAEEGMLLSIRSFYYKNYITQLFDFFVNVHKKSK
jgi:glycosyltransferase involved in cell wall biosynthesis